MRMKPWIPFLFMLFLSLGIEVHVKAHVIDETKTYKIQNYENYYPLIQSYTGESGVTFESYSPKWNQISQLQALEKELLQNKQWAELAYLDKVMIFPDYPTGDNSILGQYFAQYYVYENGQLEYDDGRVIHLYGGNDFTTVEDVAYTLSHEYGHHFTYYYFIQKEQLLPDDWLKSEYVYSRALNQYANIHVDGSGPYRWNLAEIVAEDYVQLFGSETAIQQSLPMNTDISSPFETPDVQAYWKKILGNGYEPKEALRLYLTNFHKDPYYSYYDVQFTIANLNQPAYIRGEGDFSKGYSSYLTTIRPESKGQAWVYQQELPYQQTGWMLDGSVNETITVQAISYEDQGFNQGSAFLKLPLNNLPQLVTTEEQLKKENVRYYTMAEKKRMLTEIANEKGIPAEILKAIAFVETGMKQFDEEGNPIVSEDGGIGMMQVTLSDEEMSAKGIDKEKLMWDTRYNIEVAADILLEKWNYSFLPKVNDHHKNYIEDWYFAVMAYNGLSKRNDPSIEQEETPYQERVFEVIRNYSLLEIGETPALDIRYTNPEKPDVMVFPEGDYVWPTKTRTRQNFQVGDVVYTFNPYAAYSNVRDGVDGDVRLRAEHYTPVKIVSGPYETEKNPNNQYVMYEVEGNGFTGYIASSNLMYSDTIKLFPDIVRGEVARAVAYLQNLEVINGYTDGTFRPNEPLLRRHAAKLLVKALGLELPEDYQVKATDMKPGDLGYDDMAIAEAYGLMGNGGQLRPDEHLTRAQMAAILVRAFGHLMEKPTTNYSFQDVDETFWNYKDINTLAHNKITIADPFRPNTTVTRSQFSLFLQRTLQLEEN
jgi:hypothetical protein